MVTLQVTVANGENLFNQRGGWANLEARRREPP